MVTDLLFDRLQVEQGQIIITSALATTSDLVQYQVVDTMSMAMVVKLKVKGTVGFIFISFSLGWRAEA